MGNSTLRYQQHRARLAGVDDEVIDGEIWVALLEVYEFRCAYCGALRPLELDHVVPLPPNGNGRHRLGNVAPACKPCNASKKNLPLKEWLVKHPELKGKLAQGEV